MEWHGKEREYAIVNGTYIYREDAGHTNLHVARTFSYNRSTSVTSDTVMAENALGNALTTPGGHRFRTHRPSNIVPELVREELGRIVASQPFSRTDRPGRLLTFLVEHALTGEAEKLNEYVLAVEVFGRKQDFDAGADPIVRVEAGRLRRKLQEYYESEGREDTIAIELPQRTYIPAFRSRQAAVTPSAGKPSSIRGLRAAKPRVLLFALIVAATAACWSIGARLVRRNAPGTTHAETAAQPGFRSVVVLPFADLSSRHDQANLCDGLSEELIETLSRIPGLHVVSRTTAFHFKGAAQDVRDIGRQLNVGLVLDGSVRKDGGRLRIVVQLINAVDGYQIWTRRYDRYVKADFAMEEEIARDIAASVAANLDSSSTGPN